MFGINIKISMSNDLNRIAPDDARGQGPLPGGRPAALTQGKLAKDRDGQLTLMRPALE